MAARSARLALGGCAAVLALTACSAGSSTPAKHVSPAASPATPAAASPKPVIAGEPGAPLRSYEQPVLVYQRYGRGLSVAFTIQDSWHWQMDPTTADDDPTF